MPDFKQTFQDEVRRLARKELKAFEAKINEQKKTISALTKRINELERASDAQAGVVDQYVYAFLALDDLAYGVAHGVVVADVHLEEGDARGCLEA